MIINFTEGCRANNTRDCWPLLTI